MNPILLAEVVLVERPVKLLPSINPREPEDRLFDLRAFDASETFIGSHLRAARFGASASCGIDLPGAKVHRNRNCDENHRNYKDREKVCFLSHFVLLCSIVDAVVHFGGLL